MIGQSTIPLNDVIRAGTIKRRVVQLTNPQGVLLEAVSFKNPSDNFFQSLSRLNYTLHWNIFLPMEMEESQQTEKVIERCSHSNDKTNSLFIADANQFDDVPLNNNTDSSWKIDLNNDLAFQRQNKPRSTKPQDFQVKNLFFKSSLPPSFLFDRFV